MKNFNLIRKNEGLLWEKAFDGHRISDCCIVTMMEASEPHNNFNQVFYWGDEKEEASALEKAKKFYQENNTYGFVRVESSTALEEDPTSEAYIVIESPLRIKPKRDLKIRKSIGISDDPNFTVVFKDAFGVDDSIFEGFEKRMNRISSEMESKYLIGYFDGKAVTACGLYKSENYWFLMNFATLREHQGKGYGQSMLVEALKEVIDLPLVMRTSSPSLIAIVENEKMGQLIWSISNRL